MLRRRAKPVETVTPEVSRLIDDMIETMRAESGIGLAAPQVGVPVRLMVVAEGESRKQARALVNPVIVDRGGSVTAEEGCLSLPGVFAPVTRSAWVRLEARDADGVHVELTARGLKARVFQHELDHLDGVLFIDHLDSVTREEIKRAIKKDGFPEDASHHAAAL